MDAGERLRTASKLLFGNRLRVEVGAAIARADPGIVYARSLATRLGVSDAQVQLELKRLAEAGILIPHAKPAGQRIQYYERLPSAFWEACLGMVADLAPEPARVAE